MRGRVCVWGGGFACEVVVMGGWDWICTCFPCVLLTNVSADLYNLLNMTLL